MPNQKISIRNKRVLAWLLAVCLILSNSLFTGVEVKAEGETQTSVVIACTLKPKVKVGGKEYTIPNSYAFVQNKWEEIKDAFSDFTTEVETYFAY